MITSKSTFARHRGVSRQSVSKMIAAGRIGGAALTPDGRIVVAEADRQLGPVTSSEDAPPALAESKARKAAADARRAELAVAEMEGRLIDKAATLRTVQQLAQSERDAILAWPARAAPIIAAELGVDEHALHAALADSLRAHLTARATDLTGVAGTAAP